MDRHGGASNARKPAVLTGGLKWQQIGFSPKDMDFISQREWSRTEIAIVLGVPLLLLGITEEIHSKESARNTRQMFWEESLIPLLRFAEKTLERDLFLGRGGGKKPRGSGDAWAEYDLSKISVLHREDREKRETAKVDRDLGFPLNEINQVHKLGYAAQDNGDEGIAPISVQPMSAVFEVMEESESPEPPTGPE